MRRCAFTLIELLGVVVILSLAAGVAIVSLGAAGDSARWHAAVAAVRDLDARARLHARVRGPVILSVDAAEATLRLQPVDGAETLSQVTLGERARIVIKTGRLDDRLTFDSLGHGPDYEVELHLGGHTARWSVAGLTGLVREEEP